MGVRHWLQLSLAEGLGPILIRRMVQRAGSAENAVKFSRAELESIEGIGTAKARGIADALKRVEADAQIQYTKAKEAGASLLCPEDAAYPELLRPIPDPPPILYVLGQLEARDLQSLAIVGSRRCSYYGREQAERFAALLAGSGFTIVSGGARGIDSAAHRGALQHPVGRTIAVLGSGLDVPYPPENEPLFTQIRQRGAVVSEFPFGTPPTAENFPRRNRIVSGLSRGVLVVEADERSGALITARLANEEHGRPVFALPGRIDNTLSAGPHQLIRDGAILVSRLEHILEGLGPLPYNASEPLFPEKIPAKAAPEAHPDAPAPAVQLTDRQRGILEKFDDEPTSADQLIERSGLEAATVLQELTYLSLKGIVKRVDGQTYARASRHR